MKSVKAALGSVFRQCVPASLKARIPVSLRARGRAVLGIEPWPDLAVRHPLFRTPDYRRLREEAKLFDARKSHKPILERGHQASYVIARWFVEAGVRTAFHVGYANGRYLFYLSRMGIVCGGTDLAATETAWAEIPFGVLAEGIRRRVLRVDFFDLSPSHLCSVWGDAGPPLIGVLFSEATFETLLPWRREGVSVPKYATMDPRALYALMHEEFPAKLAELKGCFRNMVFVEPEPTAGGAGGVFEACARQLAEHEYSVWRFRPPFRQLFRLSPREPTTQVVYAYARDPILLQALRAYADPILVESRCVLG